jgi:shikimate kinase / 3-dehydroquinate synthase
MAEVTAPGRRTVAPLLGSGRKLVFIGFMGAGKSTAARKAAQRLGVEAIDSDALLEQQLGEPIESFFDREGEEAFRAREQPVVLEQLERPGDAVLALGGGAVTSEAVRLELAQHVCVFVDVDLEVAWQRSKDSGRPLAHDRAAFERLHVERLPIYESLASAKLIWAPTPGGGHPIFSGRGVVGLAGALWPLDGRTFLIADETALRLHGERLTTALAGGTELAATVPVPAGESSKTIAAAERVLRELAAAGMERSDAVCVLGGGVAGDLGGFCAAVYQRGVPVVQVPSTVVAQVDSAYGGKTGVDIPEAKNYVGVFHQPAAVFTDPELLATLPAEELRAGFAEILKTALIAGDPLLDLVRGMEPIERSVGDDAGMALLEHVVEGCLRTKVGVVARDERDTGFRAALNLGHTTAHALEAATGYDAYRHGEAVAVGLLVALRLSERHAGLDPRVREEAIELLRRHGLATGFSGPSTGELLEVAARDKKRQAGKANLVLLRAPGDVATHQEVPEADLAAAIEEVRE